MTEASRFFPEKYEIEEFGLSVRECELLLSAYNGSARTPETIPTGEELAADIAEEAYQVQEDYLMFGHSLVHVSDDTSTLRAEFGVLSKKL